MNDAAISQLDRTPKLKADYDVECAKGRSIPWWIWGLILGLGAVTPLCHYWVSHCPPPTAAFTGMRIVDDGNILHSMRVFLPGFRSPYLLSISPRKPKRLLGSGRALLLGAFGVLGNLLGIDEFFSLGLINGISGALYLLAVYLLLREVAPCQANLAFCLHALGGGLAGVTFILSLIAGWSETPTFQSWFYRFAQHELYEGVTLNPITMFPRMSYPLALACLFASITLLHRFLRLGRPRRLVFAGALAFAGTYMNIRYGLPLWFLVMMWLLCAPDHPARRRIAVGVSMGTGVMLCSLASTIQIALNPAAMVNQLTIRESVLPTSLLLAGFWHAFAAPVPCLQAIRRLPLVPRTIAYALAGWLVVFVLLLLGYNLYYGSLLTPADFTATLWSSDKALAGAALGAWLAFRGRRHATARMERTDWLALWFLLFIVASIGLFFGGWILRLTPPRQLILASVPLCVLSAKGIQMLKLRVPSAAYALTAAFILCGVCSQAISLSYYLGPLGWHPDREPHPLWQCTTMSGADAECIEYVGEGTVLTPVAMTPAFGDIIGLRNDHSTVFGISSMAVAGVLWEPVREDLKRFFSVDASDSVRREVVEKYAVKYIYCPDTTPVPKEVIAALQRTPWLETVKQLRNACVLRVTGTPDGH